uniref:Inositol-1-monophosphatase n=1 Tax=Chromera velia CCMP2878 TaxID=1169474 RepID=A0A0G4F846_9ALVE|eukprot:Cvel_2909.t1-p1 / transcript=Cvel_2909.t1 / gene=Cvel_2909 / organism=Chromera_velia_CCMP2878 / gene_product=Inositol monophosphatase 1, putative / transcript_product=Inositol monophosphatase 1, putative / location=Cvel_scaffold115:48012-53067(+) / protein_length=344 / sequence_SO=supercontig / SO=protein_coding / is_pseudo=false
MPIFYGALCFLLTSPVALLSVPRPRLSLLSTRSSLPPSFRTHRKSPGRSFPLSMTSADPEVTIEFLKELAEAGGALIRENIFKRGKSTKGKISAADLVTETDVAVEKLLISKIKEKFPAHKFLCEESATSDDKLTDEPTWIIDPIDGTANFVHTFPFASVSIGFSRGKEVKLGAVYNPVLNEMFTATKGGGAFLNGEKITVSGCTKLSESLVSTGFCCSLMRKLSSDSTTEAERKEVEARKEEILKYISVIMQEVHDIRRVGSAALDLCQVAMGRTDMYFEFGPHEWDVAAGSIILEEAGGFLCDLDGAPFDIAARRTLAAASKDLAMELVNKLAAGKCLRPFR